MICKSWLKSRRCSRGLECAALKVSAHWRSASTEPLKLIRVRSDLIECSGLLHEGADQIVDDGVQGDLLADHVGSATAQHVHAEGDFNISEKQLNTPAAQVELCELLGGVSCRVGECRDQDDGLGSESGDVDLDVEQAQSEGLGQCIALALGEALGRLRRFVPDNGSILGAQPLAFTEIARPGLMQTHDRINAPGQQFGNGAIGAEATVGQDHVAFTEEVEALTKELAFMNTQITFCEVQQSAAGEAKASDQFGYREAAARALIRGLGPNALIFGGIRHGDASAFDDFDVSVQPQLLRAHRALQLCSRVGLNVVKALQGQA